MAAETVAKMKDAPGISRLEIAVSLQDAAWTDRLEDLENLAERSIGSALAYLQSRSLAEPMKGVVEISLLFADDATVAEMNQAYRGRSGPTNVLSFPNMEAPHNVEVLGAAGGLPGDPDAGPPRLLGDIVLARETVLREAAEQEKPLQDHTLHLLIHGLLHLLGYDHENDAEAEEMEALEVAVLADLGVPDPYRRRPAMTPGMISEEN